MRQHKKIILSILDDFSNKEDQLQLWSNYHQREMLVFASERLTVRVSLGLTLLMSLVAFGFGVSTGNFWLLLAGILLIFVSVAWLYVVILGEQLWKELSDLSLPLQKHAIEMKTKPVPTILNRLLEIGGAFLNAKMREWKKGK